MTKIIEEFAEFIKNNNVLGAAVAFIAGLATKDLVDSLVNDVIMPIIGIAIPNGDWKTATFNLFGAQILIGSTVSAIINFVIIMFAIFMIVKAGNRMGIQKKK